MIVPPAAPGESWLATIDQSPDTSTQFAPRFVLSARLKSSLKLVTALRGGAGPVEVRNAQGEVVSVRGPGHVVLGERDQVGVRSGGRVWVVADHDGADGVAGWRGPGDVGGVERDPVVRVVDGDGDAGQRLTAHGG